MRFIEFIRAKYPGIVLTDTQLKLMEFMDNNNKHYIMEARHSPIKRWWDEYGWSKLSDVKLFDDTENNIFDLMSNLEYLHQNSESIRPKVVWDIIAQMRSLANTLEQEMSI